jgi:DNA-binding CsgD family transcriptional regulator
MDLETLDPVTLHGDSTTFRAAPTRTRDRPIEGWESLTGTELRVADVVSRGLTNAEAGRSMCLSRHTIDFHLRQIFRKLNVHSRVGLTRLVLERDA